MNLHYETPILEIWEVHFEENILSGERGSHESVSYGDDPFQGGGE